MAQGGAVGHQEVAGGLLHRLEVPFFYAKLFFQQPSTNAWQVHISVKVDSSQTPREFIDEQAAILSEKYGEDVDPLDYVLQADEVPGIVLESLGNPEQRLVDYPWICSKVAQGETVVLRMTRGGGPMWRSCSRASFASLRKRYTQGASASFSRWDSWQTPGTGDEWTSGPASPPHLTPPRMSLEPPSHRGTLPDATPSLDLLKEFRSHMASILTRLCDQALNKIRTACTRVSRVDLQFRRVMSEVGLLKSSIAIKSDEVEHLRQTIQSYEKKEREFERLEEDLRRLLEVKQLREQALERRVRDIEADSGVAALSERCQGHFKKLDGFLSEFMDYVNDRLNVLQGYISLPPPPASPRSPASPLKRRQKKAEDLFSSQRDLMASHASTAFSTVSNDSKPVRPTPRRELGRGSPVPRPAAQSNGKSERIPSPAPSPPSSPVAKKGHIAALKSLVEQEQERVSLIKHDLFTKSRETKPSKREVDIVNKVGVLSKGYTPPRHHQPCGNFRQAWGHPYVCAFCGFAKERCAPT